jgi:hypothetical protein
MVLLASSMLHAAAAAIPLLAPSRRLGLKTPPPRQVLVRGHCWAPTRRTITWSSALSVTALTSCTSSASFAVAISRRRGRRGRHGQRLAGAATAAAVDSVREESSGESTRIETVLGKEADSGAGAAPYHYTPSPMDNSLLVPQLVGRVVGWKRTYCNVPCARLTVFTLRSQDDATFDAVRQSPPGHVHATGDTYITSLPPTCVSRRPLESPRPSRLVRCLCSLTHAEDRVYGVSV